MKNWQRRTRLAARKMRFVSEKQRRVLLGKIDERVGKVFETKNERGLKETARGAVSAAGIVAGVAVAALLIVATVGIVQGNNAKVNYDDYNLYSVIEADEHNGEIADHVKGSLETAKVVIFEYADFQCPGCASINPKLNAAIEAMDGKVAVVYRNFLLSYHQNGTAAASAAEAAGLQGYWKEYGDKLFARQDEWEYAEGSERDGYFEEYFSEVTNGEGDMDQFNSDRASSRVSDKISFDMGIGKKIDVQGTPAFYYDGQVISWSDTGSLEVNGKTISWDSNRGSEEGLTELFSQMVEAAEN